MAVSTRYKSFPITGCAKYTAGCVERIDILEFTRVGLGKVRVLRALPVELCSFLVYEE
ncbi:MAG: hypothetical protein H8E42_14100 [Nitrospinae bacterium]|nr:hypothetical protein [Nitrospinota bacterium]MBL7021507.1 hypothetical protein [Nitrospinaceae bacterium]